jgi:hypothetical protein
LVKGSKPSLPGDFGFQNPSIFRQDPRFRVRQSPIWLLKHGYTMLHHPVLGSRKGWATITMIQHLYLDSLPIRRWCWRGWIPHTSLESAW